jgi:hypothetical protein
LGIAVFLRELLQSPTVFYPVCLLSPKRFLLLSASHPFDRPRRRLSWFVAGLPDSQRLCLGGETGALSEFHLAESPDPSLVKTLAGGLGWLFGKCRISGQHKDQQAGPAPGFHKFIPLHNPG